jgi:hypothetical protein
MNMRNAARLAFVVALGATVAGASVGRALAIISGGGGGTSGRNPSVRVPATSPGYSGTPSGITEVGKYTMAVGGTLHGGSFWGLPSTTYKVNADDGTFEPGLGGARASAYFAAARSGAATAQRAFTASAAGTGQPIQEGVLSPASTGTSAFLRIKVDGVTHMVGFASVEERDRYVADLRTHASEMGVVVKSKAP